MGFFCKPNWTCNNYIYFSNWYRRRRKHACNDTHAHKIQIQGFWNYKEISLMGEMTESLNWQQWDLKYFWSQSLPAIGGDGCLVVELKCLLNHFENSIFIGSKGISQIKILFNWLFFKLSLLRENSMTVKEMRCQHLAKQDCQG